MVNDFDIKMHIFFFRIECFVKQSVARNLLEIRKKRYCQCSGFNASATDRISLYIEQSFCIYFKMGCELMTPNIDNLKNEKKKH